jgi:hypothetical protein
MKNGSLVYDNEIGVVEPNISVVLNGTLRPITNLSNDNRIATRFVKRKAMQKPQCTSKQVEKWGTGSCNLQRIYSRKQRQFIYSCNCRLVDATTIMNTLQQGLEKTNV